MMEFLRFYVSDMVVWLGITIGFLLFLEGLAEIAKALSGSCPKQREPEELLGPEWRIVPAEPTEEMLIEADALTDLIGPSQEENTAEERLGQFRTAWTAMLNTAPKRRKTLDED